MARGIRGADEGALQCMDFFFHAFEHVRKHDDKHPRYWGTYRYDLCIRCGTVRRRIQNSDGSISPSPVEYEWSDRYLHVKHFSREACRLELDRRANAKPTVVIRGGRGKGNLRVAG